MFGSKIKQYRLNVYLNLREFCKLIEIDTVTWSKVEREIIPPPLEIVDNIPKKFSINESEWKVLRDEAIKDHKRIKIKNMSEKEIVDSMPMFLRFSNFKTINQIVELIKSVNR
jgi:transcriptional regulator with XRE-family HTH domain